MWELLAPVSFCQNTSYWAGVGLGGWDLGLGIGILGSVLGLGFWKPFMIKGLGNYNFFGQIS